MDGSEFSYGWMPGTSKEECDQINAAANEGVAYYCNLYDILPSYSFTETFAVKATIED